METSCSHWHYSRRPLPRRGAANPADESVEDIEAKSLRLIDAPGGNRVRPARTLLMTLWAVPDDTVSLMDDVYRLHLSALEKQRDEGAVRPGTWAAFIAAGDWR